jgi:hypothetical protein
MMERLPGYAVRAGEWEDLEPCQAICVAVHGFSRDTDIKDAIQNGTAAVVERQGFITGYTCGVGFRTHSVALTDGDLRALIASSRTFAGPGFLVPAKDGAMFRWCLDRGLRVIQPMFLMTRGWYQPARGAYLPSVCF